MHFLTFAAFHQPFNKRIYIECDRTEFKVNYFWTSSTSGCNQERTAGHLFEIHLNLFFKQTQNIQRNMIVLEYFVSLSFFVVVNPILHWTSRAFEKWGDLYLFRKMPRYKFQYLSMDDIPLLEVSFRSPINKLEAFKEFIW